MSSPSQDPETILTEQTTYLNPAALELQDLDFQQWRHHPVTRCYLLFLAQRAKSLQEAALVHYRAQTLEEAEKVGLRGRILELEDLCIMKLADMQHFYGKEPSQPAKPEKRIDRDDESNPERGSGRI